MNLSQLFLRGFHLENFHSNILFVFQVNKDIEFFPFDIFMMDFANTIEILLFCTNSKKKN